MVRPVSKTSVDRQDSDSIVKSIGQSTKSCESRVQSTVQSPGIVETQLREVQKQIGIQEKKLIQEVETGWNSSFYMFERMAEQYQAVTNALCLLN